MKRIIYSLMAMLLVFTGSLQAQTTKAIPEDPTVPHFVKLEVNDPEGGTFTGTADVAGFGTIDIAQGVSTDLPNATIVKVIAKPNEGWKIDRITEQLPGQEESDMNETDIEAGYESSFELTDNRTLKAYFIQIGSYSVKYDLENLKVTPEITSVKEGEPLTVTLVPNETYFLLPDHIRVTMGDPNNVLSDEVYDAETGAITIPNVTGNIEITAEAVDNRYYTVTVDAKNLTYDKDAIKPIKAGYPLNTIIFTPEEGYKLPTTAKVTMGGRELTAIEYAYDSTIGALEVPNVRGDIVITIEAVLASTTTYKITYDISDHLWMEMLNPTLEVPSEIEANKFLGVIMLYAEVGYKVPETISVTMGGVEVPDAYLFIEEENRGEIKIGSVTGDVVITANEVVDGTALDIDGLDGIQITEVPPIILWDPLPLTLRADVGYHLPETITVKMNGETLIEGEDYKYAYTTSTAVASLYIYEVTGPIEIIAKAVKDEDPDDPDPTPDPDPEDPDDPDPTPTPDPDPEDPDDPDSPTATADISGDVVKVWAANGVLHIHTPQPATVRVVSFSGALFRLMDVPGGDVQFTLPDNLYIVTVGDEVKKIKVR